MDPNRLLDVIRSLSTCGTLVLDSRDKVLYVSGVFSDRLPTKSDRPGELHLGDFDLPREVLGQISHGSRSAISSRSKKSFSAAVPVLGNPHLWAFTFSPSFDIEENPEAVVVSAYDMGGTVPDTSGLRGNDALMNVGRVPLLPGSILTVDGANMTVTYMNAISLASLGVKKEDILGTRVEDLLMDSAPITIDEMRRSLFDGQSIIRTESVCIGNMGIRYHRWIVTPSYGDQGPKLIVVIADVTDQVADRFKEMSMSLFRERLMLRTIIDTIPIGMVIADTNDQIWLSNEIADQLWPPAGHDGSRDITSFTGLDENNKVMALEDWPLYKALHRNETTEGLLIRVRHGDRERTVMTSAAPLRSEDGMLLGGISVFQDITAQIAIEEKIIEQSEELKRSNEELQQFAYVASHDLKEPLRMVVNFVRLLEKNYAGRLDQKGLEYIKYAAEGASRMKDMIEKLLEYSRVDRGDETFCKVDMEEALERVVEDLKIGIADSGAVITHDQMPEIIAIRAQMIQLLENLIGNAIKFRAEVAPQVHISGEARGDEWLFAVKDNGIGIDPPYREKIFDMFQRLHARDEYDGTGMGLALARRIVEYHGGRIWVESEPGEGSTFFFTIPADHRVRGHREGSTAETGVPPC